MDEINELQQPGAARPPSEAELRYYYFGFYRMLRRYRVATLVGWAIVAVGCATVPLGWSAGRPAGLVDIVLACVTIVAGLGLVSQSISCLEGYVRIVLPSAHNGEESSLVHEILGIMADVDDGGWQEAHAAIKRLTELEKTYGLPPLN